MEKISERVRFRESGLFDKSYRDLPAIYTHPELSPLVASFTRNCDRVFQLPCAQINIVVLTAAMVRADANARSTLGAPMESSIQVDDPEYKRLLVEFGEKFRKDVNENPNHWAERWELGSSVIGELLDNSGVDMEGYVALFASMAITGWMCFESLATDLWVKLVDLHPNPLARNVLRGSPPEGGSEFRDQFKTLSLGVLDKYQFDLSKNMGSILRDNRKVYLDSFKGILSAYSSSFGELFNKSILDEEMLKRLEAHRNMFSHRGGKVDATFIRNTKGMQFRSEIELDQDFFISGDQVRLFMNAVVQSGSGLIKFANDFLNGRPSGDGGLQGDLGLSGPEGDL